MARKILAVLAIVWALAVPAIAIQNQNSGNRPSAEHQKPAPTVTNNESSVYYQQNTDDKPKGWHRLISWPEGITTWAIILTLGAIT
jgi:hypothetical protein